MTITVAEVHFKRAKKFLRRHCGYPQSMCCAVAFAVLDAIGKSQPGDVIVDVVSIHVQRDSRYQEFATPKELAELIFWYDRLVEGKRPRLPITVELKALDVVAA